MPDTQLATVIDSLQANDFSSVLMHWLHDTVQFDGFVILGYPESGELAVYHDGAPEVDHVSCNTEYRGGMWLLSPLYLHARQGYKGFFHISDISGVDFKSSDFYTRYYLNVDINDHVAFITENGAGEAMVVSIERSSALPSFTPDEHHRLRDLEPLITSLVSKNWPGQDRQQSVKQTFNNNDDRELLKLVCDKGLTPREEEVLLAMLKGLPNKLIARELDISVETVKVYCKNILRKFGAGSRGEIFAQVLKRIITDGS